jgi:hypothetical protein
MAKPTDSKYGFDSVGPPARLRSLSFTRAGHLTGRLSENPSQPLATQAALHLEDWMQANRNNKDAPEDQYKVAEAKESQPRLVCQK